MEKVIVLSRCSTVYQDVTQQTDSIMKQVHLDGYNDDQVIVIENNESGSRLSIEEREGLNEMFSLIDNDVEKSIKSVYCFEISRIGRKPDIVFKVRDFLLNHGVNLVCVKPYFKMLDEDGKISESSSIMFGLFAVMAESETRTRVERTMRGKRKLKAEKKWAGGWIRFGYSVGPDKKYILNDDAETVKEIFDMYLTGLSVQSITKELIDRGKLNYDRLKIGSIFVGNVLKCKEYYNEEIYPKIIEKSVFDKVQQLKSSKKSLPKTFHKHIYYCESIIRDYKTGQMMIGQARGACYRNKEFKIQISINLIDSIAWTLAKMNKVADNSFDRKNVLKKLVDEIAILEDKIKVAEDKITKFDKQRDMIEIRLIKGKISEEVADSLEKEIEADREKMKYNLGSLEAELRLKNKDYWKFTNKDNNIVEELDNIVDDNLRHKIIHEEIKEIKVERIDDCNVKLYVMYMFDNSYVIYDLETRRRKVYLCGEEIKVDYLNRFLKKNK